MILFLMFKVGSLIIYIIHNISRKVFLMDWGKASRMRCSNTLLLYVFMIIGKKIRFTILLNCSGVSLYTLHRGIRHKARIHREYKDTEPQQLIEAIKCPKVWAVIDTIIVTISQEQIGKPYKNQSLRVILRKLCQKWII